MKKRFISAILTAAMLLSGSAAASIPASADAAEDYGLAERTADGVILHAFDWSFDTIRENLPDIAKAGYTTVQTSPVQQPKDYSPDWQDTGGQWWKLYQPLSLSIAEESWLGTSAELKALCDEADKYGIKIICDIVSNHMANSDDKSYNTVAKGVQKYEKEIYKLSNREIYFHTLEKSVSDSSVRNIVQGSLSMLPDLNTGNEYIQERVISLLKECIDCGVDGFRFDAAKHIETPADGDYASDFWPNVIGQATEYAKEKGTELYCYGEILNTPGADRKTTDYTQYLDITDNWAGDVTLYSVVYKDFDRLEKAQQYHYDYDDPSNFVVWAESHDTYEGDSGAGGIKNTASVGNKDIIKTWAIMASRAKSHPLYFARPGAYMSSAGDTAWKSPVVTEINRFHNKYVGTDDNVIIENGVAAVQRGDNGIVLVNLSDSADISLTTSGMNDGVYTDAVSGAQFTVSNGVISGKIGSSDVAVVYEGAETTPNVSFSESGKSFRKETYTVTLTLENAEKGTFSINGAEPTEFTGSVDLTLGENVDSGDFVIKAVAYDKDKQTEVTETFTKEHVDHSGVFVYFDNSKLNYKTVNCYAFYDIYENGVKVETVATNGLWPGAAMELDDETGLYFYEVPSDIPVGKGSIIFNDGSNTQTNNLDLKYESSIYDPSKYALVPYLNNGEGQILMYGDVTGDNKIASDDALAILRYSVKLENDFSDAQLAQADVDGQDGISSNDALLVLRKSVGINDEGNLAGETFTFSGTGSDKNDSTDSDSAGSDGYKIVTEPSEGATFYALNTSAGWVFNDGCKLWVVNGDTNETIEMHKQDPNNNNSDYAYVTLPADWKNLILHRTQFNRTIEESEGDPAHKVWNCGTLPDGKNAYTIRSETEGKYKSYTP